MPSRSRPALLGLRSALAIGVIAFGLVSLVSLWSHVRERSQGGGDAAEAHPSSAAVRGDDGVAADVAARGRSGASDSAGADSSEDDDPLLDAFLADGAERTSNEGGVSGETGRHGKLDSMEGDGRVEPAAEDERLLEFAEPERDFDRGSRDTATLTDLEAAAARVAEELGLVNPAALDRGIDRLVPEGSVPPEELPQAREDARLRILADAAIAEDLARAQGARSPGSRPVAGPIANTLVPAQSDAFRAKQLTGLPERLRP